MAKANKKHAGQKLKALPKIVAARISVGSSKGSPTYYANYAEISQTQHDIGICFAEIPVRFSPEEKQELVATGILNADPVAQIVIAPTLLPGLIKALQTQRAVYEKSFGPIREDKAGDKVK